MNGAEPHYALCVIIKTEVILNAFAEVFHPGKVKVRAGSMKDCHHRPSRTLPELVLSREQEIPLSLHQNSYNLFIIFLVALICFSYQSLSLEAKLSSIFLLLHLILFILLFLLSPPFA